MQGQKRVSLAHISELVTATVFETKYEAEVSSKAQELAKKYRNK